MIEFRNVSKGYKGKAVLVHFNFMEQKSVKLPDDIREKLSQHLINEEDIGKE